MGHRSKDAKVTDHGKPVILSIPAIVALMLSAGMVVIALTTLWVSVAKLATEDDVWNPIAELPMQEIIMVTDTGVETEGIKCYNEPVEVRGQLRWQSVIPPGVIIEIPGGGVRHRNAGCIEQTFFNPIPVEVSAAVESRGAMTWQINGTETPVNEVTGEIGIVHTWVTEEFILE